MALTLATVNQKGGVGKTTTAVNLASYLAISNKKILLIDIDPQGNATSAFGVGKEKITYDIYDVLIGEVTLSEAMTETSIQNLTIVPATTRLAGAEVELVPEENREMKLRQALEDVKDNFDYTIIDCPPSLSILTVNALAAADEVIIPLQCEYYALEGLSRLMETIELVRQRLNPSLKIRGILLTMYDPRTLLSQQVVLEARSHFRDKVFSSIIPRNIRLGEAPSFGQPIILYDPTCAGAVAYKNLSMEVIGNGQY